MNNLCAIFGENPDELEFGYDEEYYTCSKMKLRLVLAMQKLAESVCNSFISTVDQGAAMWGAEACIAMRENGANVKLIAVPTSELQAARWHPERRERYYNMLEAADEVIEQKKVSAEDYMLANITHAIFLGDTDIPRLAALLERAKNAGAEIIHV